MKNAEWLKRLDKQIKGKLRSEGVILKRITLEDIVRVLTPCVAGKKLIERAKVLFDC